MDPRLSAQDVLRCDLCATPVPPMYCDFCHVKLCKACVGEHISDLSTEHKVVPYKQRGSTSNYTKCSTHVNKLCQLQCENCDIHVCSLCVSDEHKGHTFQNIMQTSNAKKDKIKSDVQYLEKCLHSKNDAVALEIDTEKSNGYTLETPEAASCPPVRPVLDETHLITTIDTGYQNSITSLSDDEIWTSGCDSIMKLYNLQGEQLKSIQTKSGKMPRDIAVTRNGDLVYTEPDTRTVNIVTNKQIQEVIRLQRMKPYNVCSTSSGDLLVTINSDDNKQSKVVRYSGSTEKQTFQFDSDGKPLYSSGYIKYISENRNLDICVADNGARAVVVVNKAGKLRFWYTGRPSPSKGPFHPLGITKDSQSQILTTDYYNKCIHILNQDGKFLRYVDNCDLHTPCGLCVDTKDCVFVAERNSSKVKKIKYIHTLFSTGK